MGLPLITKAEYKAYMGLTSPNDDTKIDILIPKVSSLVKSFCRRTFVDYVNDAKTEYFDGGSAFYTPVEYPILSVTGIETSADYGNTYTDLTEFTEYAVSKSEDLIYYIGKDFPKLINGYRLTYTAGYETLPEDLKLAIYDLVSYYIRNEAAVHSSKAPGTNSVQIEYVTNTNLPAHIRRVLDMYAANYN